MGVGDFPRTGVGAFQALVTMHFFGTEVPCPIHGDQVIVAHKAQAAQHFLTAQGLEHVLERGPQVFRGHLVENRAHLGVTGDMLELVDTLEIL